MSHPKLLMLDEPSMGLALILVDQIFDIIRELHAQGTTILVVVKNASKALEIADRACVLETGLLPSAVPPQSLPRVTRCAKHTSAVKFSTPPAYNHAGGVFMCRHNQLWGCVLLAFGLGVLIGIWIEGGFLSHCFGFALIVLGWGIARKK